MINFLKHNQAISTRFANLNPRLRLLGSVCGILHSFTNPVQKLKLINTEILFDLTYTLTGP